MYNHPACYIFIGRSGSGKGTQAKLLIEYLKKQNPDQPLLYIETGRLLRQFIKQTGYTNQLSNQAMVQAVPQPSFVAIWTWSSQLINHFTGRETLIFDGSPRSLNEAKILSAALDFYQLKHRQVIYLDISPAVSKDRLINRGRADDQSLDSINQRIAWFDSEVRPAVDWLAAQDQYRLITVDGSQDIQTIHQSVVSKL